MRARAPDHCPATNTDVVVTYVLAYLFTLFKQLILCDCIYIENIVVVRAASFIKLLVFFKLFLCVCASPHPTLVLLVVT